MNERPPPLPPMSNLTGNRILIGASAAATLIGLTGILGEIMTDRGLAKAVGFPWFLSAPMGLCGLFLAIRVWQVLDRRKGMWLIGMSLIYWMIFLMGMLK